MNKIQKCRRQSRQFLISFIAVGIVVFTAIMWSVRTGGYEASMILVAAAWMIFYIQYANLKTKVEILTELEKKTLEAKEEK
jgi:uncharacterized membrane protein